MLQKILEFAVNECSWKNQRLNLQEKGRNRQEREPLLSSQGYILSFNDNLPGLTSGYKLPRL